jgi:hypothetical protein
VINFTQRSTVIRGVGKVTVEYNYGEVLKIKFVPRNTHTPSLKQSVFWFCAYKQSKLVVRNKKHKRILCAEHTLLKAKPDYTYINHRTLKDL